MRLSDYLTLQNLTHGQFAARIGTSQPTVSRYAAGQRFPDTEILLRIQHATRGEVTPNDFLASFYEPRKPKRRRKARGGGNGHGEDERRSKDPPGHSKGG